MPDNFDKAIDVITESILVIKKNKNIKKFFKKFKNYFKFY